VRHKENKQGGLDLEQEYFTKTEPKLSKYFIEGYTLLLYSEVIQIKNEKLFH
jgi:hypothetical protein